MNRDARHEEVDRGQIQRQGRLRPKRDETLDPHSLHPPDDDGFTDRVLERLPPQRRPVPRALVIGLAAMLGTILTTLLASEQIGRMLGEVTTAKPSLALLPTALVLASIIAVLVGSSVQVASQE